MSGVVLTPLKTCRCVFSFPRAALTVAFLVLCLLAEVIRWGLGRQPQIHHDSLDFAACDLVKSMLSLSLWFVCRQLRGVHSLSTTAVAAGSGSSESHLPTRNTPLHEHGQGFPISRSCSNRRELTCSQSSVVTSVPRSVRLPLSILVAALVYALRAHIDLRTREFVDPVTRCLVSPVIFLGILFTVRINSWRMFPSSFWHATVLQFAGFFITRDALVGLVLPPYSLLFAFALCNSIWISLVDLLYGLHHSPAVHLINSAIFLQSCLVHSLLFILHPSYSVSHSYVNRFAATLQALPLTEAAKDIVAISIIQQYGAISQGILISLASTLLITVDMWNFLEAPYPAFFGCLIAIFGSGIFVLGGNHTYDQHAQHDFSFSTRRCFAAVTVFLVALGYIIVAISQNPGTNSSDSSPMQTRLPTLSRSRSDCRFAEASNLTHGETISNYTHFNNVLLVVFFSHARYDANLDFHREMYADYFPNIIYIGPASREDKGFAHSYDVLVDSFQSEENLSDPFFYRMSGRMAHHMLYTALREYGCYDGYLWAPFDTLLNIPRLQRFNQSLFWYHSPWGQPVPNPAFGNLTEPVLNISRHAPPAMISPDTSINLTETWRGWGPDWWWGDPHVGVSVCMNAFRKVSEDMRVHLAKLNNGQTRLIGGSADTLYIPGRHRKAFMDVLALFLETDCFLEIATPTTVHLVVPPGESIQFVDHWWIYQPPFNASFVRQKWAEGYEVDTFHTFHWGERGDDGIWRGNHRHVADVRHLLRESANRQGLNDAFPVTPGGQ